MAVPRYGMITAPGVIGPRESTMRSTLAPVHERGIEAKFVALVNVRAAHRACKCLRKAHLTLCDLRENKLRRERFYLFQFT